MKTRYELNDYDGRFMIAEYDDETGELKITNFLNIDPDVSVEETLIEAGFDILDKSVYTEPKLVNINGRRKR